MKPSVKRLLSERQIEFARNWAATGCKDDELGESFKRANPEDKRQGTWMWKAREELKRNPYIRLFVKELLEPPAEKAKRRLIEQVQDGEGVQAIRSAERIIDLDDKLGAGDAADYWAERMCQVGAEVEIPMLCAVCRERNVSTPLVTLFPQFAEAPEGDAP